MPWYWFKDTKIPLRHSHCHHWTPGHECHTLKTVESFRFRSWIQKNGYLGGVNSYTRLDWQILKVSSRSTDKFMKMLSSVMYENLLASHIFICCTFCTQIRLFQNSFLDLYYTTVVLCLSQEQSTFRNIRYHRGHHFWELWCIMKPLHPSPYHMISPLRIFPSLKTMVSTHDISWFVILVPHLDLGDRVSLESLKWAPH